MKQSTCNRNVKRRWFCALATVVLAMQTLLALPFYAFAEAKPTATPTAAPTPAADETIVADNDAGHWLYESKAQGVRIEITRHEDTDQVVLWYEADLQFSPQSPLRFLLANEQAPGKGFYYPERLVRDHQAVFGINDDQFGHRVYNHEITGVIVRDGVALYTKTKPDGNQSWPVLDTAAFFADGTMRAFSSSAHTAEEYVAMGAQTVLSFGPWLVQNGMVNPLLKSGFKTREPRSAIGMVAPYHFVVLSVEGREKRSRGVNVAWLAERMQALGATEAVNLDGGKTCCIVFMGKKLDTTNPEGIVRSGRSVSGMIALGTSALVPAYRGLEK